MDTEKDEKTEDKIQGISFGSIAGFIVGLLSQSGAHSDDTYKDLIAIGIIISVVFVITIIYIVFT